MPQAKGVCVRGWLLDAKKELSGLYATLVFYLINIFTKYCQIVSMATEVMIQTTGGVCVGIEFDEKITQKVMERQQVF